MSNGAPTIATSGRRRANSAAVATQSRELKVGRPTLSLSEVSLSEVSLSEVSLSEVSLSEVSLLWGRSAIATGTSCVWPGRAPSGAQRMVNAGPRRRLTVTAGHDATAAGAYRRSVRRRPPPCRCRPLRGPKAAGSSDPRATSPDALDLGTLACSDGADLEITNV